MSEIVGVLGALFCLCCFFGLMFSISFVCTWKQRRWRKSLGWERVFALTGKYVTGLPEAHPPQKNIHCFVTADEFVFAATLNGPEIARIPCRNVNSVSLDDQTSIQSRITVPRILALGLFALAAPANVRSGDLILLIDWTDERGERENLIFEYSGGESSRDRAYHAWNEFDTKIKQLQRETVEAISPESVDSAARSMSVN